MLDGSVHLSFINNRTLIAPNSKDIGRDHCHPQNDTKNETVLIRVACSTCNKVACQVFLDDPEKCLLQNKKDNNVEYNILYNFFFLF